MAFGHNSIGQGKLLKSFNPRRDMIRCGVEKISLGAVWRRNQWTPVHMDGGMKFTILGDEVKDGISCNCFDQVRKEEKGVVSKERVMINKS